MTQRARLLLVPMNNTLSANHWFQVGGTGPGETGSEHA